MKKLVVITIVAALLLSAGAAMANETNWSLLLAAKASAGTDASFICTFGTYNGALDAKDGKDVFQAPLDNNANIGSYQATWGDTPPVYTTDRRAPIGTAGSTSATQSWNVLVWLGQGYASSDLVLTAYQSSLYDIMPTIKGVAYNYNVTVASDPTGKYTGQTFVVDPAKAASTADPFFSMTWGATDNMASLKMAHATAATSALKLTFTAAPVGAPVTPEPSSMVALASGLFGLVGFGIRRRK